MVSTSAQAVASTITPETKHKVALFVEPSPFSHISGMKNRFESLIKGLREAGDDVVVFTPDRTPPIEFHGAKVHIA
jgi:sulfoquinovosyltransferase